MIILHVKIKISYSLLQIEKYFSWNFIIKKLSLHHNHYKNLKNKLAIT